MAQVDRHFLEKAIRSPFRSIWCIILYTTMFSVISNIMVNNALFLGGHDLTSIVDIGFKYSYINIDQSRKKYN